jgi:hypothetical protein
LRLKFTGDTVEPIICRTVGELIEALKTLPAETIPYSIAPPFDGVKIVPQTNGYALIAATREHSKDEDVYGRKRIVA